MLLSFFFKHKTAYEMRISDWSSDVCSSVLKTDGHQLNRALLLSRGAEVDSKPELEIYADDVKCSHGATAGELDEEPLFYLLTRGIDRAAARRMLIEAFLDEAGPEIRNEPGREAFRDVTRSERGRASGRDSVSQYGSISGGAVSCKK